MYWKAIHKISRLLKPKTHRKLKMRDFKATVETIFLYGSECWIIYTKLE